MTIECAKCKAPNPEGKKYCGDCGAFLDPNVGPILAVIESNLRQQIQAALKEQFSDQKVVEIETTQAIVARVLDWAKLLGFFIGIPLALLVLLLGFLGVKTYSDFSVLVKNAQQDTAQKLQQAQQQAEEIKKEGDKLTTEYQRLKIQIGEVGTLSQEVKTLATTVTKIAELVDFKPSAALTEDLRAKLNSSFASYQSYLQKLGYRSETGQVDVGVYIDPQLKDNAYYDGSRNLIVLGEPFADDTDVIFREYTHHALMSAVKDTRNNPDWAAIESGLADYFPCSFSNDALFGEKSTLVFQKLYGKQFDKPYIRNLENSRKFSEMSQGSFPQIVGEIWGGAFWEMRGLLGQDAADKLLFTAWVALRPSDTLNDPAASFVNKLLETAQSLPGGGTQPGQIRLVFERRGLRF
jgi:hypothetical protein